MQEKRKNRLYSNFGTVTKGTGLFVSTNAKALVITGFLSGDNSDGERELSDRNRQFPKKLEISLRESAHGFESHPLRQNKVRPGGADFVLVQNEGIRRARE